MYCIYGMLRKAPEVVNIFSIFLKPKAQGNFLKRVGAESREWREMIRGRGESRVPQSVREGGSCWWEQVHWEHWEQVTSVWGVTMSGGNSSSSAVEPASPGPAWEITEDRLLLITWVLEGVILPVVGIVGILGNIASLVVSLEVLR